MKSTAIKRIICAILGIVLVIATSAGTTYLVNQKAIQTNDPISKSAYDIAVDGGYNGTQEQWLASLVGENGKNGNNGKSAYELAVENGYENDEATWLESLIGKNGSDGRNGNDGKNGTNGINGRNGSNGTNGKSAYQIAVDNGFSGSLSQWLDSLIGSKGDNGKDGVNGTNGASAYELAVQNGFEGTLTEWLASLVSEGGSNGKSAYDLAVENGYDGTLQQWLASLVGVDGEDGKSAYEIAVAHGYTGTEEQWLVSLSGKDGKSAYEIAVEHGFNGTEEEWLDSLVGADGENGIDGVGIENAYINAEKHLILVLDNGREIDAGSLVDEAGKNAVVYFSATGTTKDIAEKMANALSCDLMEIIPAEPYTSADLNYNNSNSRANREMNDSTARPAIQNNLSAIKNYDTIYIGYPIWWGNAPRIIQTFIESYDLSGKKIYTFCTSGSTDIQQSITYLRREYPSLNIIGGHRFPSGASIDEINRWLDSLES